MTGFSAFPDHAPAAPAILAETVAASAGVGHNSKNNIAAPALPNFKEHHLQEAVAIYLDTQAAYSKKFVWFHPPQEAKRSYKLAAWLKKQGLKRGPADCILFCTGGRVISIELKLSASMSPMQKEWADDLSRLGHVTYLVKEKTPQAAVDRVEEILRKERLI